MTGRGSNVRFLALVAAFLIVVAGCSLNTQPARSASGATTTAAATTTTTATAATTAAPSHGRLISGIPPVPDLPATAMIDRLRVAQPSEPKPYQRKDFGAGWSYDRRTKCNTRELVLAEESGPGLVVGEKCKPLSGTWTSLYDGVVTHDPSTLEIDHLVPLAEAWRSGAADWTAGRRRAFANDLSDPGALVAVTSNSNRSKRDSTPARWLPSSQSDRCRYVTDWIRVKYRWGLSVSPNEKAVLVQVLAGC